MISNPIEDQTALAEKFLGIRKQFSALATLLKAEDFSVQPVYYTSPAKWHLAHTTWFYEEMILKKFDPNYSPFSKDYGFLFNSYYNHVGDRTQRAERGNMTRPSHSEIKEYRLSVEDALVEFMNQEELQKEVYDLIILGMNHEQQHQELFLTDLKYTLGHNPTFPVLDENFNLVADQNEDNGFIHMPEGMHHMGHQGAGFCFDNELNSHPIFLPSFEISKALVTNGEFLEFIQDGGYRQFQFWFDEAWTWIQEQGIKGPMHWHQINGKWFQYTLAGLKPLDQNAILAHISHYEASAFAQWKNLRLPTEFEWEAASDQLRWGSRWEWTNSAYLPYPGYQIAKGAVGEYNGKFMINQMVLRGASVATPKGHSRKTYRNFFHPYFQWQYTGIRLAK